MERWNNLLKVSQHLSDRARIKNRQFVPLTVHIKLILKKPFIMCSKFHPVKFNQFSLWREKKIWSQCYHLIYMAVFQSFNWVLDQYAMKGSNETINKNATRNSSKWNPTMYNKNYTHQPSGINLRLVKADSTFENYSMQSITLRG